MIKDLTLLLAGALISLGSYIINRYFDHVINRHGEFKIYRRIVYKRPTGEKFGFYEFGKNSLLLMLPMWLEFINTKNSSVVIRDFHIALYKNGEYCERMNQITDEDLDNEKIYYGDEGRYSFIIPGPSVKRYNLLFMIKEKDCKIKDFDEIMIVYYDSKDKMFMHSIKTVDVPWSSVEYDVDIDWIKVK